VYAYHPAVTTMWVGALALGIDFPAYRGLGQGYFEKEWQFADFLETQGYHPLQMLKTSRLINMGINCGLLLAIYYLVRRLVGWFPAFVSVFLLSFEPFLLGHSRILAHEGMMSLLLLVSTLAALNFLYQGHQWSFLIISGITAGLAVLTKSSATLIVPFVGLLFLIEGVKSVSKGSDSSKSAIKREARRLLTAGAIWLIVFLVTFVAIWPGMWVNPGKMLFEMYGNAFSYAFEGHNLEVQDVAEAPAAMGSNNGEQVFEGLQKFARDIFWHATPITWLGLGLFLALVLLKKLALPTNGRWIMAALLGFGFLFYLMMSIARGRQASHYIMTTYASWSLVSGLAIAFTISLVQNRFSGRARRLLPVTMTLGFLAFQAIFALKFFPYYLNFSNPVLEALKEGTQTPVSGFGEGLELAAAHLAELPNADELTVMSWWGIGPFSFYFPGQTENLYPSAVWSAGLIRRLEKSDYLVIYYDHQKGRNMPATLMHEIENLPPEHTIWINGIEYVRIFRVSDLPETLLVPDTIENP
jgi:hypothetical protein